ncbi:MAG: hypothetical protein EON54_01845 [Alcaligenaceae bacterium]|nr:MAG: hypothetical protein EON54_01845 [Alcaligenaceae bacterium]
MHLNINDYNQNQINAALTANVETAIALWEAKDWQTYESTRGALLALIRCGQGGKVGIQQMQFIYFINTHLRHRFSTPMPDLVMFKKALPPSHPVGDKAWDVASGGAFWSEPL